MNRLFLTLFIFGFFCCEKKETQFSFHPIRVDKPLLVSEIGQSLEIIEVKSKYPITGNPTILKSDRYFYLFEQGIIFSLHQVDLYGNVRKSIDFGFDDKLNAHAITQIITQNDRIGVITGGDYVTWFDEELQETETEILPVKAKVHFPSGNQTIAHTNGIDDGFWGIKVYDVEENAHFLPIDKNRYSFYNQTFSPFSEWNNKVLFSQAFNDTIYSWDGKEFLSLFHVNFGAEAVSEERFLKIQNAMDMLAFFNERRHSYLQGEVFGLDSNRILFMAFDQGRRKLGLMDFANRELHLFPGIVDNSISMMALNNLQFSKNGDLFFGISGEEIEENEARIPNSFKHRLSDTYSESYFIYRLRLK